MQLLLVEDELDLLQALVQYLRKEGYECSTASTYSDAIRQLTNHEFDCIVLDLSLPGGDGIQILKQVRQNQAENQPGVIITTAREGIDDRVVGLDAGADDYLVKPFHLSELNARLKAILRRRTGQSGPVMQFGILTISLELRDAFVDNKPMHLTRKEFDILVYLARNRNRVVTKESLAEYLWGDYMDQADSYDFIYAHVKNLRKKLSDHGCAEYLKTVYGIGYKFEAP